MLKLRVKSILCITWILAEVFVSLLPGDTAGMQTVGGIVAVAIKMIENHDMSTAT